MGRQTDTEAENRRVALVTGGGRGIGLGISKRLLAEGYDLAFCGVREEKDVTSLPGLRSTADGARIVYIRADVSRSADRETLVSAVLDELGRIDVLVNNAGVAPKERRDLLEATEESYDRVMDINLKGPYFLTQLVARHMCERSAASNTGRAGARPGARPGDDRDDEIADRGGCIVFVTSISSTVVSINRGEYCLSKAGLSMAAQLWAVRLAEAGIPVYEVRPGIIKTDMTAAVTEKYDRLIGEGLLLQKRWGYPDDIGRAVAMLARGDLAYSTGQVVTVDGSLTSTIL